MKACGMARASSCVAFHPVQWASTRRAPGVDGAIFTAGGPADWQGPGRGFSVIEVAANSRDGLPVRAVVQALAGAPIYRTDRLGTIEFVKTGPRFRPVN